MGVEPLDQVLHAIADPTRRRIVEELAQRKDQTLYELCVRLIMKHQVRSSRQAISKHLSVLRGAGLVTLKRRGRFRLINLERAPLRRLAAGWLNVMIRNAKTRT